MDLLQVLQRFSQYGFGGVSVQTHISHIAGQILIVCLGADHGRVVATKTQGRHIDLGTEAIRHGKNIPSNPGIGSHAAGHGDLPVPGLLQRQAHSGHQSIGHRRRE